MTRKRKNGREGQVTGCNPQHFTVANGIAIECLTVEEGFGEMYHEKHPTKGFEHRGQWVPYQRYSLFWAGYDTYYSPRTSEQLAVAREKREQKAVEQDAAEHPLFADAMRSGEWRPERRERAR